MADTSQTRLAYIAETTWGTTPATPAFTNARFTGEGLSPNIDNITSNEIREDRNVTDLIQVGQSSGGTVDFELSYGAFDDWLESVLYGTWATNVLINGNTENSFTIEKTFETGATDQYHRFTGAIASSMSLSAQIDQVVTGSFEFLGKGASTDQAIITGATYTPGPSNPVINAATNFANLAITGVTSPEVTAINLNVTNNLRTQKVLGSLDARGIGTGRFEVTGDLTAYFENEELFDLYLNGTSADLSFKLGGASSLNYVFDMGTIKFETGEVLAGGNDQDLLAVMTFRALFDGVDNTLKITRTP
jgi:hypothetical protein